MGPVPTTRGGHRTRNRLAQARAPQAAHGHPQRAESTHGAEPGGRGLLNGDRLPMLALLDAQFAFSWAGTGVAVPAVLPAALWTPTVRCCCPSAAAEAFTLQLVRSRPATTAKPSGGPARPPIRSPECGSWRRTTTASRPRACMCWRRIAGAGHDLVVAAPATDASGSGAAIGLFHADSHIDVRRVAIPDCDAPAWAVAGPPGFCALAARLGAFGAAPDIVVSGINAGPNTGRAILHSGTVGAALTAQNFGAKGLAVSVAAGTPWQWDTAATITLEVLDVLSQAPPRSVLNLNVPSLPRDQVEGRPVGAAGRVRCGASRDRSGRVRRSSADRAARGRRAAPARHRHRTAQGRLRDAHDDRRNRRSVAGGAGAAGDRRATGSRRAVRRGARNTRRRRQSNPAQSRARVTGLDTSKS